MQPQQSSSSKHIQPTEVPESLLDPITKIWYELQDSTQTTSADTAQYFTLFKPEAKRCEQSSFTGH
jgi:hypothetical protein